MNMKRSRFLLPVAVAAVLLMGVPAEARKASPLDAVTVLANGTGLTCTDSIVTGGAGVATAATPITSTRCAMTTQVAAGAYAAFRAAYTAIAGRLQPCTTLSGSLAGQTLGAGTYCFPAAATLTGTLTLQGAGPWLFEVGAEAVGALTATNFNVVGANPCAVTWWVHNAVTLTGSTVQGTILGGGDITMTGSTLTGRALATGAVTLTNSRVGGCAGAELPGGAKRHCNQGVGNGPEGCDPGNSNHRHLSNDERGGTPGHPGRP